jgi:hypothetical protein
MTGRRRSRTAPRVPVEVAREPGDTRRLADPRLAGDQDESAVSLRGGVTRLDERPNAASLLEELHGSRRVPGWAGRACVRPCRRDRARQLGWSGGAGPI